MDKLHPGVRQFQRLVFPQCRDRFEKLAEAQRPSALFITCSDSRIVPNLLTQTGPGELFVLRNAGNLVPPCAADSGGEAATIEYAVSVLKVRDVIVCGHSHCGAVSCVLWPNLLEGLPLVRNWLVHAEKVAKEIERLRVDGDDDLLTTAVKANVLVQLEHLRTYPPVAAAEDRGELKLHGWFYRFETGELTVFEEAKRRFASIVADNRVDVDF